MIREDELPDAPLFALLRAVERDITVQRIDRAWVFPARRHEAGETALVVVSAFHPDDDQRRSVFAAHYTAIPEPPETHLNLHEVGAAPAERIGRLVEEVVDRLKEEPARAPHAARIDGSEPAWIELLHLLAERHLEDAASGRRRPAHPAPVDPRSRMG